MLIFTFLLKLTILICFFKINFIEPVVIECSTSFDTRNDIDLCYYNMKNSLSWLDAYHQCLTQTTDGILIQILSSEQFQALKTVNINGTSIFWLGANNLASFRNLKWRWLDGSIVDNSIIQWCPNSSYKTAIGAQCAAYDSTLQCVNNYLCNTLLSAPCISINNSINKQSKTSLIYREDVISTNICTSSYGNLYANWWTYSSLLLNWFVLFSFFLYLCNRFTLNKNTVILTVSIVVVSFILILIYAILWGVQYNDIVYIPLAIVIIGSIASALVLIALVIILSDRTRVHRFKWSMLLIFFTIIVEFFLMLGLILCMAYCSGFITLASTYFNKDIIASLLATLTIAISILFYTGIVNLLENTAPDRINPVRSTNPNNIPLAAPQLIVPPRPIPTTAPSVSQRPTRVVSVKKYEYVNRATSPVDERILNEFYADPPKDIHQYRLEGRQYVVYEGVNLTDIDTYRKDLTQAMLLQESAGLREAIDRAKGSIYASTLAEEIQQAQELATKLV